MDHFTGYNFFFFLYRIWWLVSHIQCIFHWMKSSYVPFELLLFFIFFYVFMNGTLLEKILIYNLQMFVVRWKFCCCLQFKVIEFKIDFMFVRNIKATYGHFYRDHHGSWPITFIDVAREKNYPKLEIKSHNIHLRCQIRTQTSLIFCNSSN